MESRHCEHCESGIGLLRKDARYCSTKCRVYAARKAKKAPVFPQELTQKARFVRFTGSKRPITTAGKSASSTNPETWTDYATARASAKGEGIGFVLGDGIGCIDLDHAIKDGELLPWAAEVVAANPGTFTEVSMSGDGLHIFGLLAEAPGRKIRDGRNIEVYSKARYIALTGKAFNGSPNALKPLVLPVN
jgi:primase-polymerase (primpol)-like protein